MLTAFNDAGKNWIQSRSSWSMADRSSPARLRSADDPAWVARVKAVIDPAWMTASADLSLFAVLLVSLAEPLAPGLGW